MSLLQSPSDLLRRPLLLKPVTDCPQDLSLLDLGWIPTFESMLTNSSLSTQGAETMIRTTIALNLTAFRGWISMELVGDCFLTSTFKQAVGDDFAFFDAKMSHGDWVGEGVWGW
ncbi:MAG: hypothetical protein AAGD07_23770 [Planctomycetota bacterium]